MLTELCTVLPVEPGEDRSSIYAQLFKRAMYIHFSLVTRPGFSLEEPRRAASAGLEGSVKFYHSSIDLLVLDGFGGARWRNNSIPQ